MITAIYKLLKNLLSPTCWSVAHLPATNTLATIGKAAPGAGFRLVATSLIATIAADATAPTAIQVSVSLIEDAAGTPVTLWAAVTALQAIAGDRGGFTLPIYIPTQGVNKSLTLAFSAAGGAQTFEAVALTGITIPE